LNIPGQPSLRSGLFPALRAIALTCVAATCLGAPASRSDAQPDKADAARVLDQFRRSLWADPVYAEFDLRQMPRRGDERLFHGRLWGAQNERGPITRFELDVGKGGFTHRLLVQSGPEPALWVSDGGTSGASNDHALVMPLISGLEMTPFDLTMPYLYWLDFGVSGLQRIRGRPAFIYLFTPPADFSLAYPGIKSMAAYLDTQYAVSYTHLAMDGVTQQDKAIAGEAVKDRKPIAIIVNKWDLVHEAFRRDGGIPGSKSERDYREKYEKELFNRLFFTPGAPLIFVSAMSGFEVSRMLNAAVKLHRTLDKKLPTARLNETLSRLAERTPPPAIGARRFKIYYATQTGNRPFRIKIFCNREERLMESYRRYLEAGLVKEFELNGCPIEFELVGKPRGEEVNRSGWK